MIFITIPRDVYVDSELTDGAKLLYGLILTLSFSDGFCYATNEFLAKALEKTSRSVNRYFVELKEKRLIAIDMYQNRFRRVYTATAHKNLGKRSKSSKGQIERAKKNMPIQDPDWMADWLEDLKNYS